ncbi:flagellar hook assembly protein FlgD [Alteribacter natronophilus]|uniref:flagellar hook assembly protein FlgD n=1 Tax=Alteribacter natronophilus TaxID=2583810 RepID=UPI00110D79DB|nr:flagellar hook assembly protein FlgD [Alteribacter natronophilus]TMW73218.1 flagellar hook assembly protein FlgD [Alteribacter natronophilus]
MVMSVTDSLYLDDYRKAKNEKPSGDLDKDAFLKILITQLQNQDPLNPMEDKEFIAQMAQFTSLEQLTNIGTSVEKMAGGTGTISDYAEMIGKRVEFEDESSLITGTVTSVTFKEGTAAFIIDGDKKISPAQVRQMSLTGDAAE